MLITTSVELQNCIHVFKVHSKQVVMYVYMYMCNFNEVYNIKSTFCEVIKCTCTTQLQLQ